MLFVTKSLPQCAYSNAISFLQCIYACFTYVYCMSCIVHCIALAQKTYYFIRVTSPNGPNFNDFVRYYTSFSVRQCCKFSAKAVHIYSDGLLTLLLNPSCPTM